MTLFSSFGDLLGGLAVGICFGFLLRKAHVTRFDIIVKQLLLENFTVLKVMLTAIAFGSFGIYLALRFVPGTTTTLFTTTFLAATLGGAIFGLGMAIMGFCPGTAIAALADGAKDMVYGILGMVAGALIYAESAPLFTSWIKSEKDMTKITLPELTGWPYVLFPILLISVILIMIVCERAISKK